MRATQKTIATTSRGRPSRTRPQPVFDLAPGAYDRSMAEADKAFVAECRAAMDEEDRLAIERLGRVKATYVASGRDDLLARSFRLFLQNMLTDRDGQRDEGRVFIVTGRSGAGKSAAVRRMLKGAPCIQPIATAVGELRRYVSIGLRGYTQPRIAAQRIIVASGYPLRRSDGNLGDLWDTMPWRLREQRTMLVHVDETQHLFKENSSQQALEKLGDAIKGVGNDQHWPISFVLSGLPTLSKVPLLDQQINRRANYFHLADVDPDNDKDLIVRVVRAMAEAAYLDAGPLLEGKPELPLIIAHSADNAYGRICQAVEAAMHHAIQHKRPGGTLSLRDFERAYDAHSQSFGIDGVNPFNTERWWDLPRGTFIIDPDRYGPGNPAPKEGKDPNEDDGEEADTDTPDGEEAAGDA